MACVEIIADGVVVGWGGYDHEVGVTVSGGSVEGRGEVEVLLGEIFLDVLVLDGRLLIVYEVDFLGDDVDCGDTVVLCQQSGYAEADVSGAGYCDIHNDIILIGLERDRGFNGIEGLEEVGVDEGEHEKADAFDADYDVAVAGDADHGAFVAGEEAAGDADALVGTEAAAVVDGTAGGVVGGEELEEVNLSLGDGLDVAAVGVTVHPEGYGAGDGASFGFEAQCLGTGGADEEDVRYDGALALVARGGDDGLRGEVYLRTDVAELAGGAEVLARANGEPFGIIG